MTGEPTPQERRALFRVVRGDPSDAEVAALTVVLAAVAATPIAATPVAAATPAVPGRWSDPSARFRAPLCPGPGAWRMSTWPR